MKKILIVEDDDNAVFVFKHYLKNSFDFDVVSNGEMVINNIAKNHYDLILMDINLQKSMDGISIVKLIRENKSMKDVCIIAVTAYNKESYLEKALKAGCDYFLSKPFEKKELLDLISEAFKEE
jgi:CheY-like chemotaxis protein